MLSNNALRARERDAVRSRTFFLNKSTRFSFFPETSARRHPTSRLGRSRIAIAFGQSRGRSEVSGTARFDARRRPAVRLTTTRPPVPSPHSARCPPSLPRCVSSPPFAPRARAPSIHPRRAHRFRQQPTDAPGRAPIGTDCDVRAAKADPVSVALPPSRNRPPRAWCCAAPSSARSASPSRASPARAPTAPP